MSEILIQHSFFPAFLGLAAILLAATLVHFVAKSVLFRLCSIFIKTIPNVWTKSLLDRPLIAQTAWILTILTLHVGLSNTAVLTGHVGAFVLKLVSATLVAVVLRALTTLLGRIHDAYSSLEIARNRPIKGFIQVIIILLYVAALILIVSILLDKSPWVFLSGLGAMTAILILIFRDTLLSLVAGLQLISNDLIRVGDWIEMSQFGADGDVIDIALHTVRVQNWDRTITVIPTHKFLENSFKNWRGMQESGGRRIKRSIYIDMHSIRFLSSEDIERLKKVPLLRDYLEQKTTELAQYASNETHPRRLTNVGTFRAYLVNYLKNHPRIQQQATMIVRQLEPSPQGLPIEIYAFANTIKWVDYEGIQSDIFDHVLAIAPEFGLTIFQYPSSSSFRV